MTIDSLAAGATATLTLTGLLTTSTPQTNTAEVTAADQFGRRQHTGQRSDDHRG